jgi:hypothetical protein
MDDFCGGVKFAAEVWKRVGKWEFGEWSFEGFCEGFSTFSENLEGFCGGVKFMVAVWSFGGGWQCGDLGCIVNLWVFIEMASECMEDFCGGVNFLAPVWKRFGKWELGELGLEAINTISERLED